jgi:hypothetical protein
MKNKSFLSNFDELKPKTPLHLDVERKLLPRLKFMGYVMCVLCIASLIFAILAQSDPVDQSAMVQGRILNVDGVALSLENPEDLLEFNPCEVLNFYFVGFIFALVGSICFLTAWKKKRVLFHKSEANGE